MRLVDDGAHGSQKESSLLADLCCPRGRIKRGTDIAGQESQNATVKFKLRFELQVRLSLYQSLRKFPMPSGLDEETLSSLNTSSAEPEFG
jgi:hypothetical protein